MGGPMRSHSGLKARPETELRAGPCALGGRYVLRRRCYRHRDFIPASSARGDSRPLALHFITVGVSACALFRLSQWRSSASRQIAVCGL